MNTEQEIVLYPIVHSATVRYSEHPTIPTMYPDDCTNQWQGEY